MAFVKMLWASGSPIPLLGSWDYWTSVAGYIFNFQSITIQKVYPIIAYYAIVHSNNSYTTIMISTEQNAVVYKDGWDNRFYSRGTITDTNNITWYWSGFERGGQPIDMSLVLNDTEYEWSLAGGAQAAQDLLDRIYAVPFHEDYQVGQTYNTYFGNKLKTIRKAVGIFLFKSVGLYGSDNGYTALSDNVDTIISTLMAYETPKDWNVVNISFYTYQIIFHVISAPYILSQITIFSKVTGDYGYDYYKFRTNGSIRFSGQRAVITRSTGEVSYAPTSTEINTHIVGISLDSTSQVGISTIGLDL